MVAQSIFDSHVDIRCCMCGVVYTVMYNREDMIRWLAGEGFIQDLMDYLTDAERELLISKTCGSCFDKLFPPLDSEE